MICASTCELGDWFYGDIGLVLVMGCSRRGDECFVGLDVIGVGFVV